MTVIQMKTISAGHEKKFMVKTEWKDQWAYFNDYPQAVNQAQEWARAYPHYRVFVYKMQAELKHEAHDGQ